MSGDAVRGIVATVRGDLEHHAKDFFLYYLGEYKGDKAKFPNYRNVELSQLPDVRAFKSHSMGVVEDIMKHFEVADNAGKLKAKAAQTVHDHVARHVGYQEFENSLHALEKYVGKIGGDTAAWGAATQAVLAALK